MVHGTQAFFRERDRARRRVSGITASLSVAALALLGAIRMPAVRHAVARHLPAEVMRFGFEGQEQYVRRIRLESSMRIAAPPAIGVNPDVVPDRTRGGADESARSRSERAAPETRAHREGEGDAERDLVARARRRSGDTPIFQSEELVIEELVRPNYPEAARARGIEGKVAVMALVDTSGRVVDTDVMDGGLTSLGEAARAAVRRCRFRPYLVDGQPQEVYAMFRFSFRLY